MSKRSLKFLQFPSGTLQVWAELIEKVYLQIRTSMLVAVVVGLLTAIVTLILPNQYRSEARILPADQRVSGGLGTAAAAAAAVGVNIPGQESADSAYVDILNSRSLREELLQTKFRFQIRTWYFGKETLRDQTLYDYLEVKNADRALVKLKSKIFIQRDLKSKLLTIGVETESPELSQKATRRLAQLLDEFVVLKSQTRGSKKVQFAEKRLVEARFEMAQAEDIFRVFLDQNRNYLLSPDPSVRLKGIRLDNEFKLRTQLVTTLAIAREQALLEEKNDMPILNFLDVGNLPIEKSGPSRAIRVISFAFISFLFSFGLTRIANQKFSLPKSLVK